MNDTAASGENLPLTGLLRSPSALEHRMRRGWFEKRIARSGATRYVLYRFLIPAHAERLAWMLDTAAASNLPLQRHLGHVSHWRDALRHRGYWTVTSYEPGEPLEGVGTESSMASLGRLLAGLHRIESPTAYRLFSLKRPVRSYRARLQRELRGVVESGATPAPMRPRVIDWLAVQGAFLDDLATYQLAHGDLYGRNILVRADGGVTLVDYELAEFEPAGLELATALLRAFCGQSATLRGSLLAAYLKACPPHLAVLWETHCAFFLTAAAFRLAGKRQFRARRLRQRGQSSEQACEQARTYTRWGNNVITAHGDGVTDGAELLEYCR